MKFTLELDEQDVQALNEIVRRTKAPYDMVSQFNSRINAQLAAQQKAAPAPLQKEVAP